VNVEHRWALDGFEFQRMPAVLSEFGGIKLGDGQGWGYTDVQTAEEFLNLFAPVMKSVYGRALTGYCYTQLTDTFQEANGLLYADRTPKVDPVAIAAILNEGLEMRQRVMGKDYFSEPLSL
jgi:hypothetical protein